MKKLFVVTMVLVACIACQKNNQPKTASNKILPLGASRVQGDPPNYVRKTKPIDVNNATRMMTHKVKTARGRKISSKLWIERQINDPYVKEAKIKGYRSRAAFKLLELNTKFELIKKGALVVD